MKRLAEICITLLLAAFAAFCFEPYRALAVEGGEKLSQTVIEETAGIPTTQDVCLVDDNGTEHHAKAVLVDAIAYKDTASEDEYISADYAVNVYTNSYQQFTLSTDGTDGSISLRSHLTITYRRKTNADMILLTKVSGGWTKLDNSIIIGQRILTYGCGNIAGATSQYWSGSVNNNFSKTTGFDIYVPTAYSAVGANLAITLSRTNGSSWTFNLSCTV